MLRFVGVFFSITYLKCTSTLCCYTFQVEHLVFHSEEISVSVLILLSTFKILKQNEKCKFSFPFGVLLSCSNVRISPQNENAMGMRKKKKGGRAGEKSIECTKPVTLPTQPRVPTVYSGVPIFSDGTESTAFPSDTHVSLHSLSREAT